MRALRSLSRPVAPFLPMLLVCAATMAQAQPVRPPATPSKQPRPAPGAAQPRQPAPLALASAPGSLDERIEAELAGFKGKAWIYAKNLDTGATYSLRGEERVRTASTIKLPIMIATFAAVAEGKARWDDELLLTKEKKVSGSGILTEFHDGTSLTLRDAVHLMIVVSDNTATNLVLDHITAEAVNVRMDALGLTDTRALRKVGGGGPSQAGEDPNNRVFGLGVSTPRDMVTLIERLERGELMSPEASKEMVEILRREQSNEGIGRTLYDVPTATKSGALDRLRSDVGIVYSRRGRIAMAITVDDMPEVHYTPDNPGLLMISRLSLLLLEGLGAKPNRDGVGGARWFAFGRWPPAAFQRRMKSTSRREGTATPSRRAGS